MDEGWLNGEAADGPQTSTSHTVERKLKPAVENPWYILATVHGEQSGEEIDWDTHAKNRRTWNRWVSAALDDEAKQVLVGKHGVDAADLAPLELHERGEIEKLTVDRRGLLDLALPAPGTSEEPSQVDLYDLYFTLDFNAAGFVFPGVVAFDGSAFRGCANFTGAVFLQLVSFERATVRGIASFTRTVFRSHAAFAETTFSEHTGYASAIFRRSADFENATFRETSSFIGTAFRDIVEFEGVNFQSSVFFERVMFRGQVRFNRARFEESASFIGAIFRDETSFASVSIQGDGLFMETTFRALADFSDATFQRWALFSRASFLSGTSFDGVSFSESPNFRDAKLPFSTTWRRVTWPDPTLQTAEDDVENYAALRHAMDFAKRHDAELDFFVRELQARRYTRIDRLRHLAIGGYVLLSDGGRSFGRPAVAWLFALSTSFVGQTLALMPPTSTLLPATLLSETLRLSLASAFVVGAPIFDPRRLHALEEAVYEAGGIDGFPLWLQLLQLIHAGFSALCLFLMALAIRNWLRLR